MSFLTFQDEKEGTFNTFMECYEAKIGIPENQGKYKEVVEFVKGQAFAFIEKTEE